MSIVIDIEHDPGDYLCLAQKYGTEVTINFVKPGRTIAQTPDALDVMYDVSVRMMRSGGSGLVFVLADKSALVTTNTPPDMFWVRWVT